MLALVVTGRILAAVHMACILSTIKRMHMVVTEVKVVTAATVLSVLSAVTLATISSVSTPATVSGYFWYLL